MAVATLFTMPFITQLILSVFSHVTATAKKKIWKKLTKQKVLNAIRQLIFVNEYSKTFEFLLSLSSLNQYMQMEKQV